jgi:hypothetical protein
VEFEPVLVREHLLFGQRINAVDLGKFIQNVTAFLGKARPSPKR